MRLLWRIIGFLHFRGNEVEEVKKLKLLKRDWVEGEEAKEGVG